MNHRQKGDDGDDIDARVAALRRATLATVAGARIHARAREAFLASPAGRAPAAAAGRWARLWNGALEPAAVALAVVVYLLWTAQALAAIDWGRFAPPPTNRVGSMAGHKAARRALLAFADRQRAPAASGAASGISISGGILIGGIGGSKRASSGNGWLVRSGLRSHSGTSAGVGSAAVAGGVTPGAIASRCAGAGPRGATGVGVGG